MDRKQFLKGCADGVCACAAACFLPVKAAAAADAAKPDWRLHFVKERYAHLMTLLSDKIGDTELAEILWTQGKYCSALGDATLVKYRDDVEGYAAFIRKTVSADIITYDRANRVITMTTDERPDCFCPLNGLNEKTPGIVCNCSLGWQTHSWETILGKKVNVEIAEAVLRGGKRCTFKIHVLDQPV